MNKNKENDLSGKLKTKVKELEKKLKEYQEKIESLEESEEKYKLFFEKANDGIFTINKLGNIKSFNPFAEKQTGYKKKEVIGKNFKEFVEPSSLSKAEECFKRTVIKGESVQKCEISIKFKDGSICPFEMNTTPIRSRSGKVTGGQVIARDISERKRIEERLELANLELEKADTLKNEFLANTSHELRSPLTSIIGFIRMVLDDLTATKQEEKEILNDAHNNAIHLLSIIDDILDIAKIEAGRMEFSLEEIDVGDILNEVKSLTYVQAKQKDLDISIEIDSDKLLKVYADRQKLKQIFVNLIGNSIKFAERGCIKIKAYAKKGDKYATVEIADKGIGIPKGKINKLFEKFSQIEGSFTRKKRGTGLGLTISKSLIELMNGKIELHSDGIGKGTTAKLEIPIKK